jgi:hypothetical protein
LTAEVSADKTSIGFTRSAFHVAIDPRDVIADPKALYAGAKVSLRTLLPDNTARLGETRFETSLNPQRKFRVEMHTTHGMASVKRKVNL